MWPGKTTKSITTPGKLLTKCITTPGEEPDVTSGAGKPETESGSDGHQNAADDNHTTPFYGETTHSGL